MSTSTSLKDCPPKSDIIVRGPIVHATESVQFLQRSAGMTGADVTGTLNAKTLETLHNRFGDLGNPDFSKLHPDVVHAALDVIDRVGAGAFKLKHDAPKVSGKPGCKDGVTAQDAFKAAGQPTKPKVLSLRPEFTPGTAGQPRLTPSEGALTGRSPAIEEPGFLRSLCPEFICGASGEKPATQKTKPAASGPVIGTMPFVPGM